MTVKTPECIMKATKDNMVVTDFDLKQRKGMFANGSDKNRGVHSTEEERAGTDADAVCRTGRRICRLK